MKVTPKSSETCMLVCLDFCRTFAWLADVAARIIVTLAVSRITCTLGRLPDLVRMICWPLYKALYSFDPLKACDKPEPMETSKVQIGSRLFHHNHYEMNGCDSAASG